jgi:transcriptional regulator with XRE-family HTH domain
MAIVAQLEESAGVAGKPREHRRELSLEAHGALISGNAAKVLVHNISATGLLLESPVSLAIDEKIGIQLPHAGANWAKVIWASGNLYGCQFETPVSAATLSAAQLRSAVGQETDIAARSEPPADGSFGVRLQRLRAQRGLSQSQIAAHLGVSKPTVWAWEHGKARPIDERIEALAEMLGVSPAELLSNHAAAEFDELIVRSRAQIAAAVGTSPEKVRIWVEL